MTMEAVTITREMDTLSTPPQMDPLARPLASNLLQFIVLSTYSMQLKVVFETQLKFIMKLCAYVFRCH